MARPRRKKTSPIRRLLGALAALALLSAFLWWSNTSLQVDTFTCNLPRLPADFEGFTIVQLSDLHGAQFGENNEKLLQTVAGAAPDLIVITGDLLDQGRDPEAGYVDTLAKGLTAIAPTYFVTGNHEWARPDAEALKAQLRDGGVTVLSNGADLLTRGDSSLVLAGIDAPNGYADQKTPEELRDEIYAGAEDPFWILLAHRNTLFKKQYSLLGADLVLSGHGHGGLVRLPFTDGLFSTDHTLFPSYTAGFYEANGSTLFVSRGLGNSGYTFRLFNRPQVAVLTLHRGA